jgi:ribosomal protein S18 acetylase RimI-like enzyme
MPLVLQPSWVGRRVTVRRVVDRAPDGRLLLGDVVGDLVGLDAQTAVVETRNGLVEIPVALVSVAKLVPASTADELALEDIVARGWQAAETDHLGGWLLRASGGFTGRGNSVLPLRQPGVPLDEALTVAAAWYAERGLPLTLQIPTESRRLLDAELGERGWDFSTDVHVMTGRLDVLSAEDLPDAPVLIDTAPDDAWLTRYRDGKGTDPNARGILTRHERVAFASIRSRDGEVLAIGRGTVDEEWLGVTAVEVATERRRSGLARAVTAALWSWGLANGALRSHLEVSADNAPAIALYERLGYRTHHDYRYRTAPAQPADREPDHFG